MIKTVLAYFAMMDLEYLKIYQSFRKPNNEPKYIDINSTDPPQILKQLPKSIERKISEISSSKELFDNSKPLYEKPLQDSSFKQKLLPTRGCE